MVSTNIDDHPDRLLEKVVLVFGLDENLVDIAQGPVGLIQSNEQVPGSLLV